MIQITGLETTIKDITEWLDSTEQTVSRKIRHAISETVNMLSDKARQNLASSDLNVYSPMPEGGTLYQGIQAFMYRKDVDEKMSTGVVHILGNRNENDGTWRLRFFEGGTQERVQKSNGKSLGRIRPRYFFRDAIVSADQILKSNTDQSLNEIK